MAEEIANEEFGREKFNSYTIFNFFSMGLILLLTTFYVFCTLQRQKPVILQGLVPVSWKIGNHLVRFGCPSIRSGTTGQPLISNPDSVKCNDSNPRLHVPFGIVTHMHFYTSFGQSFSKQLYV